MVKDYSLNHTYKWGTWSLLDVTMLLTEDHSPTKYRGSSSSLKGKISNRGGRLQDPPVTSLRFARSWAWSVMHRYVYFFINEVFECCSRTYKVSLTAYPLRELVVVFKCVKHLRHLPWTLEVCLVLRAIDFCSWTCKMSPTAPLKSLSALDAKGIWLL